MIKIDGSSFAHEVLNGLWIGSAPPIASAHENSNQKPLAYQFDTLVLCAQEYQLDPALFSVPEVLYAPMDDAFEPISKQTAGTALKAARAVVQRLADDQRVLVTCLAGRNRSGMVCALALMLGPPGLAAGEAIELVRAARGPNALANPHFVRFLQSLAE